MAQLQADVLVIGGGATGAGVAWDAALRGFDVVLADRADLAEGTSGRFHGLLHSGGRYVVKDYIAAVARTDEWLRDHPPAIEWGVSGVAFPPSELSLDHPFAQAVASAYRDVAGEPRWAGFEAVSDLAWLAEADVPGLLYGPGDAAQAHTTAEYVDIEDLLTATKVVALAIVEWCGVG